MSSWNIREYSNDGIMVPNNIMEIYFGLYSNSEVTVWPQITQL